MYLPMRRQSNDAEIEHQGAPRTGSPHSMDVDESRGAWQARRNQAPMHCSEHGAIQGGAEEGGPEIQIRIESIDERGRATGTYCSTRPDTSIFGFELRAKGGVKTSLKKGVLKFSRSKRKYALSMNEDGTMQFKFSRKGKKSPPMTMERSEANGCLKRFATAGETARHTVPEGEQSALIGVWEGSGKNKLKIGIHVASIRRGRQGKHPVLLDAQGRLHGCLRHRRRSSDR